MNFRDLLQELDIQTAPEGHPHSTTGWVQFDCPFCGSNTKRYHMGYNESGGFANCWKCGPHPILSVLHEHTQIPHRQLQKLLQQLDSLRLPEEKHKTQGVLEYPKGLGPLKPAHHQYLRSRGFHPTELVRLWKIQGIGIAPPLSWRIFIPIQHKGKTVSWTSRSIADHPKIRYISAKHTQEAVPHKQLLYGQDYVRHSVIIVEGPLDVWAIGPGAVATFGIRYTQAQITQLSRIPKRIVCYDSEPDAQKQAKKLVERLGVFPGETLNVQLDSKDAADSSPKERAMLRKLLE